MHEIQEMIREVCVETTDVVLDLRDLGTLEGLRVERVTDLECPSLLDETFKELIIDALLDKDTRSSTARLTVVPAADDVSARLHSSWEDVQDTKRGPVHCLLQIRIVEDDVGALSTQFQGHVLQVALGRSFQDLATDECRTSEGDLFDLQVMRDGRADSVTVTSENVDDAWRETSLVDKVGYAECSQGSELRGLENNCVSRCQGGADFPGQHEHCTG